MKCFNASNKSYPLSREINMKKFILILLPFLCFSQSVDTLQIKNHLTQITKNNGFRNYQNLEVLNSVADYIYDNFEKYSDSTYFQKYKVYGKEYKNVVAIFNPTAEKTIVIGAHYDVCGNQEGADDNASGIVGLLELARMFSCQQSNYRIELVAYTLEEPPYFRTEFMGSHMHANSLKEKDINVYGMICLEMIGYFDDKSNTQNYPLKVLKWQYGTKGDYIALVNKYNKGSFAKKFNKVFKNQDLIKTEQITGPKSLQGLDFSDHLNYWNLGYSAVMITDTSFYRNKNYHELTDTLETLNIDKMAKVIETIYFTILDLE